MPQSPNKTSPVFSFTALLLLILVVSGVIAGLNHQKLQDWWRLRGYQPSTAINELATQDTMNSYTRHLFYLNRPRLLSTVKSFRQYCPENKDTIVLGCYHPDQNGIFIYNVSDQSISGVEQVTAAHEVLHSIYARLGSKDRQSLDTQLESYYKHGLTNQRVLAEVKIDQQTEPTAVMDEMSCTFGTEIANLPAPLESYYKRYFNNRPAIVAYEQQYEAEFTSRQNTIAIDDQQLNDQKQQVTAQEAALSFQLTQINSDRARLSSLLASGQTTAYNASVTNFNNEIRTYNDGVTSLQTTISSYNQLVTARNLIAGQLTTLDSAIDTRLTQQSAK